MLQRNVIRFEYVNAEGHKDSRFAELGKLIFKNKAWYLVADCRQHQEHRTFDLCIMEQAILNSLI
jgi:predicted DNA-binding transcriptional regulator YafY